MLRAKLWKLGGLACLALVSCQTPGTTDSSSDTISLTTNPDRFALVYQSARRGSIEPCGCTFIPRGGIVREWIQRQSWAKQNIPTLNLQADTAFLPAVFFPANADYYQRKASLIAGVMARMKIDVYNPSLEDFALGEPALREWQKLTRAQWISANLYDHSSQKRLFPASYETKLAGHRIQVVGVSSCQLGGGFPAQSTVDCRKPVEALREVMADKDDASSLKVLIGALTPAERTAVREAYPQIRIVFNSESDGGEQYTVQEDASHLYVSPLERSMQLVRLVLAGPVSAPHFYYPTARAEAFSRASNLKVQITLTEMDLKQSKTKDYLSSQLARYRQQLAGAEQVTQIDGWQALEYAPTTQSLDESLEPGIERAQNPMAVLYDRFQKENRDYLEKAEASFEAE